MSVSLNCLPGCRGEHALTFTYKYNLDQTLEVTARGPDGRTATATIERQTLDAEEVAQAAKELQTLEVE